MAEVVSDDDLPELFFLPLTPEDEAALSAAIAADWVEPKPGECEFEAQGWPCPLFPAACPPSCASCPGAGR